MHHRLHTTTALLCLTCTLTGCNALGPAVTTAGRHVERWHAGLVRKEVDLDDGTHIAYLDGGSGDPLVLIHGLGADKDNFTPVARWLTPRFHVIVPDLVGFGESTHPPDADYRYAAQAARLHAFVHALGLRRVDLGGNSMGGAVALSYAVQHPQDVASLWLLDTAGIAGAPPGDLEKIIDAGGRNPLIVTQDSDLPALLSFVMKDPPYVPKFILHALAQELIANEQIQRRVFEQIAHDSVNAGLDTLHMPTLLVWGADDRVLSPGAVPVLKALLPQAQVVVMPDVGHAAVIEQPRQSADAYLRFRAESTPAAGH